MVHRVSKAMTNKEAIRLIDEYLAEQGCISQEWIECLQLCRKALKETDGKKVQDCL